MTVEEWLGKDNQMGIDIWHKKYQYNNETFEEWIDRISGGNSDLMSLIYDKKFLPGGRILANRGIKDAGVTYSNCYVIAPPEDNIESIYETCKKLAKTYSYGGGCGIDISKLAPAGAKVNNQAKSTSGAVSFMDTFSQVTSQIGQNGRRGALMISLDCTHPDLEAFIDAKKNTDKVTSANISVRVSYDFMRAVRNNEDWELSFYRKETDEYIRKTVKAKEIFHHICENNWDYAEPGILFWDDIKEWNMLSNNSEFEYSGVNPCAEEPLPAGGSCLLGALNLASFVKDGKFDYDDFNCAVDIAVRALNDILDEGLEKHPLIEQRESVRAWRQIGLGIMGLADMLIKLGIRYGSQTAVGICNKIGSALAREAILASSILADERGPYPKYDDRVKETDFFKAHKQPYCRIDKLRNSQLLTIAPTGSISTMLGVSGGIEPIFANKYTRMTKSLHGHDEAYEVYTPIVDEYMKTHDITDENDLPDYFITSSDIPIDERIAMQAAWQNHIDASISSTINLPNEATIEDIEKLYIMAWEMGLKGVTVYRAGCAREGILTVKKDDTIKEESRPILYNSITPVSRKTIGTTHGNTYCKKCACGTLYITLNRDSSGNIVESFVQTSKGGICQANIGAVNRLISLNLRSGVKVDEIIDQLSGITCKACTSLIARGEKLDGISCSDIMSKTLAEFYKQGTDENYCVLNAVNDISKCPECGASVRHEGGCIQCLSCGWSKCN